MEPATERQQIHLTPQDVQAIRAIVRGMNIDPDHAPDAVVIRAAQIWMHEGGTA